MIYYIVVVKLMLHIVTAGLTLKNIFRLQYNKP